MPEATPAAVTPTPSNHPNAPSAVAAPVAGASTQTQPPAAGSPPDITARYKQLESEHQKKVREHIVERRKWEGERKTLSDRAQKAAEYEKQMASARLNPPEFLKSLYGEQWHEMVTEAKVNGVAPGQLIQQEMQKLRDEFEQKDKARQEESSKARESAQQQQAEQARRSIFADAASFYREKAADYPLLKKLGGETVVARTIAQRIESEFHRTVEFDEAGNVSKQGTVLTTAQAADLIESEVLEWAAEAAKHEKYKAKLQPSSTSSTVASGSKQQQGTQQPAAARRSITNDITGSTPATKPPMTDRERRERAEAAYDAARASRKG